MSSMDDFFAFARERHTIHLRRRASLPAPWTTDAILQTYRFTNVFRQLDRTTQWYTENVREKVRPEHQLLAAVIFRWFNRITTGEAIFAQPDIMSGNSAFERMIQENDTILLRGAIEAYCGSGPYVTGAYIIKTPDGYNKLDGVLKCIEWFMEQSYEGLSGASVNWQNATDQCLRRSSTNESVSLYEMWLWLRQFPYLGDFMAYEIVTDLRWSILSSAPDIMTWANPGPGATRGIGRIIENDKDAFSQHRDKAELITNMRILLDYSRDSGLWPQKLGPGYRQDKSEWFGYSKNCNYAESFQSPGDWPVWEMRDVEHTLCEFDKYERVRTGEGRPRGRYR